MAYGSMKRCGRIRNQIVLEVIAIEVDERLRHIFLPDSVQIVHVFVDSLVCETWLKPLESDTKLSHPMFLYLIGRIERQLIQFIRLGNVAVAFFHFLLLDADVRLVYKVAESVMQQVLAVGNDKEFGAVGTFANIGVLVVKKRGARDAIFVPVHSSS